MNNLAVIIHGGAGGAVESDAEESVVEALKESLNVAWNSLCKNEGGDYAVASALRILEASEYFNAGYGGCLNEHGKVFLDCAMMNGTGEFSGIINFNQAKYPSQIVFEMLRAGHHRIRAWTDLAREELNKRDEGFKRLCGWVSDESQLIAPRANKEADDALRDNIKRSHGTVGCVVRDSLGRVFAGTSTGGIVLKPNGRVGDTPIIGGGTYADNEICALSTTGSGEIFLRSMVSGHIVSRMRGLIRENRDVFERRTELLGLIINEELSIMKGKFPQGHGGVIVVPVVGAPAYGCNSKSIRIASRFGTSERIISEEIRPN